MCVRPILSPINRTALEEHLLFEVFHIGLCSGTRGTAAELRCSLRPPVPPVILPTARGCPGPSIGELRLSSGRLRTLEPQAHWAEGLTGLANDSTLWPPPRSRRRVPVRCRHCKHHRLHCS